MFETEVKFFNENKLSLLDDYNGKYVVIKGERLLGVYKDQLTAIKETMKTEKLGTFMVKFLTEHENTPQYYSRVSFK